MKIKQRDERYDMRIIKANITHASMVGDIHSKAWIQTYKDLFPIEYLEQESSKKREEEFMNNQKENIQYYLIEEDDIGVGVFKTVITDSICELASIYILEGYHHRGYGTACIDFIKSQYSQYIIQLWTLEENINARKFYEKNNFHDTGKRRKIYRGENYIQMQYATKQRKQ